MFSSASEKFLRAFFTEHLRVYSSEQVRLSRITLAEIFCNFFLELLEEHWISYFLLGIVPDKQNGMAFAKQLYWNRTSALVFSCKLAAYFQSTFSKEQLWTAASIQFHGRDMINAFLVINFLVFQILLR